MAKKSRQKKKKIARPAPATEPRPVKRSILIAGVVLLGLAAVLLYQWLNRPGFDGARALGYIETQCEFGPRAPGSEGHRKCGDFLVSELKRHGDRVAEQTFSYVDRTDSTRRLTGRNIVASFNTDPERKYRIMLSAHWDTRPVADRDPDSTKRSLPVPGANDGASGVAVLLELARCLAKHPLPFGVDIILFDLEDMGEIDAGLQADSTNPYCIGSEYFASTNISYRPRYGILLDMVGERDLRIPREEISQQNAPALMDRIWQAAREIDARAFVNTVGPAVSDDHVPFLRRGIPVVDLIDFDYPYWHTVEDTPDKCSEESLQQVGDVLIHLLYEMEP